MIVFILDCAKKINIEQFESDLICNFRRHMQSWVEFDRYYCNKCARKKNSNAYILWYLPGRAVAFGTLGLRKMSFYPIIRISDILII